jgi:peptidoglycan-associated lipoprotein
MTLHSTTRHGVWAMLIAATLVAAGCNRDNTLPDEGAEAIGPSGADGADTTGFGDSRGIEGEALDSQRDGPLLQQLVIYFDYDQTELRPEFNSMLSAHGQYLASNPRMQLRLEGHADERGSREYNIGLGERRAQAVRRVLMLQGASADQLSTVSYGEERPAAVGSDEEAMSLNRRVELVYRQ